jgi:2-hydroxychromene-2-carboxylate isomerase/rhodanese-related sulfurtransferase
MGRHLTHENFMTTNTLAFYYDLGSPYAYVAAEKIERLAARYGFTVDWRPIALGLQFKVTGGQPLTAAHPWKAEYAAHDFMRNAQFHGVPMSFPSTFPLAAITASRMAWWLHENVQAECARFSRALFNAYFVHNKDISNNAVCVEVANQIGLDGATLLTNALSDTNKQAFTVLIAQAQKDKIFGVPMFLFADGQLFWGTDRLLQVEAHMKHLAGGKGYKAMLDEAEETITTLSISQAQEKLGQPNVVFVDLRDPRELEREGMVPDALHATRGMLEFWVDPASPYYKKVFTPEKEYVLYCGGGWRSALAAKTLQEMGRLPNVAHIEGGFTEWKKAGAPVVDKPAKA